MKSEKDILLEKMNKALQKRDNEKRSINTTKTILK